MRSLLVGSTDLSPLHVPAARDNLDDLQLEARHDILRLDRQRRFVFAPKENLDLYVRQIHQMSDQEKILPPPAL